jgi:hypothetical protein
MQLGGKNTGDISGAYVIAQVHWFRVFLAFQGETREDK